jgi:ABC-2 type transport system permease protein
VISLARIRVVVRKEWEEVFRNRLVLVTMLLAPILFVIIGLVSLFTTSAATRGQPTGSPEQMADLARTMGEVCLTMSVQACMIAYMGRLYYGLFLMLPVILPAAFASYSVVGEKTSHTLEPLLATPIRTSELLAAKALAAVIPAMLITWLAASVYMGGLIAMAPPGVVAVVLAPEWILALVALAPLLAVFGVTIAIIVSSRVDDPRSAQQIASLLVLPMLGAMVGQSIGVFVLDPPMVLAACGVMIALDAAVLWIAVRLFERENILTRWK